MLKKIWNFILRTQLCEATTISFSTMQKVDKKCAYTISNGLYKFGNSFSMVMNMYFSFSIYLFYIFEILFFVTIGVQIY
jgi:hypothetical protein